MTLIKEAITKCNASNIYHKGSDNADRQTTMKLFLEARSAQVKQSKVFLSSPLSLLVRVLDFPNWRKLWLGSRVEKRPNRQLRLLPIISPNLETPWEQSRCFNNASFHISNYCKENSWMCSFLLFAPYGPHCNQKLLKTCVWSPHCGQLTFL